MEKLKAKLNKQGGFTMVELLIVVAIIAILVAVSIPMMNSALEKSRHAVDQANVRDAIALVSVKYTTDPDAFKGTSGTLEAKTFNYHVDENHQGYLSNNEEGVEPQCQCSGADKATGQLTVKLTPPATGEDAPTIETAWHYDTSAGYTKDGPNTAPTAP